MTQAHVISIPTSVTNGKTLITRGRPLQIAGVVFLIAGAVLGWRGNENFLLKAWIQGWLFAVSICLGALFFTIIQHLVRAGWSVVVRRPAEAIAANLQWLWLGFLPFVFLWWQGRLDVIFPWASLEHLKQVDPAEAAVVAKKAAFLNVGFFMIRSAFYLVVWAVLARFFISNSTAQDHDGRVEHTTRMAKWSGPAAIVFGLTITFASVDWIMSLNPVWFSTMFGVYFFAACCAGGFSMIALVCLRVQGSGYMKNIITPEHYQDLGKMLFAFGIVFWAYIAFSQYMLIWYGNVPEETTWFLARQIGQWRWVSVALLFGHFIVPFLFLISRWTKRWRGTFTLAVIWMLIFHWVDLAYLIQPVIPHDLAKYETYDALLTAYANERAPIFNPVLLTISIGFLILVIGGALSRLSKTGLLCTRDPRLAESLRFENM